MNTSVPRYNSGSLKGVRLVTVRWKLINISKKQLDESEAKLKEKIKEHLAKAWVQWNVNKKRIGTATDNENCILSLN